MKPIIAKTLLILVALSGFTETADELKRRMTRVFILETKYLI